MCRINFREEMTLKQLLMFLCDVHIFYQRHRGLQNDWQQAVDKYFNQTDVRVGGEVWILKRMKEIKP